MQLDRRQFAMQAAGVSAVLMLFASIQVAAAEAPVMFHVTERIAAT